MIRIHYRPLEGLKPIHIAVLASLTQPADGKDVIRRLSIPQMMLDHALDDLLAWSLVRAVAQKFVLTGKGNRCVAVWTATDKKGFWEFKDGSGWLLGKGVFSFRKPLKSIKYANLNPETGDLVNEKDARERLKKQLLDHIQIEKEIKQEALRDQLLKGAKQGQDLSGIVRDSLTRAKTRSQVNQLCRLAESALDQLQHANVGLKGSLGKDTFAKIRATIPKVKGEFQREIRDQESNLQELTDVLLAAWLADRSGLLNEVARSEPGALVCRSECNDFSWMEDRPATRLPHEARIKPQRASPAPREPERQKAAEPEPQSLVGSILNWLFR